MEWLANRLAGVGRLGWLALGAWAGWLAGWVFANCKHSTTISSMCSFFAVPIPKSVITMSVLPGGDLYTTGPRVLHQGSKEVRACLSGVMWGVVAEGERATEDGGDMGSE